MLRFTLHTGGASACTGGAPIARAAAVAVASTIVLATSSAEARRPCALQGGTVVAQNGELSVSHRLPLQGTRDRTRRVYFVCRFNDGRQRHLVTSDESLDPFVSRVRVAGRYVAWAEDSRFRDQFSRVVAFNARTRKKRTTGPLFATCIRELFLTRPGSAVWSQTGEDCAASAAPILVFALDPGPRSLVGTAPGIDRASLAVARGVVSWRVGGISASAKLRG